MARYVNYELVAGLPQVMLEYINRRDHRVMHRVNNWRAPRWVRLWMICATRGGDGWLWYAIITLILLFGGRERFAASAAAGAAAAAGCLIFITVKRWTHRKRPCAIAPHCWATLLPPDQFSFPSGHTITAFAFALPLALVYADLAPLLLFMAFSIGTSRVILGMHFLSDVLVGAAIGSSLGYAAFHIAMS